MLDHGIKPIYEMTTEDGRAINTTAEHPYFVRFGGNIRNPNNFKVNSLPLNSEGLTDLNKNIKDENTVLMSGGLILMSTIPEYFSGGNKSILPRCLSKDNIILSSDLASLAISSSSERKGALLTSNPSFSSNSITLSGIFSSEYSFNLLLEEDIFFLLNQLGGIIQGREDSFFGKPGKVIPNDFIWCDSGSQKIKDLPDHYSSIFESRLSMADFAVNDNILINFGSHNINNDSSVFKFYDDSKLGAWIEVRDLSVGMEIAVPDYEMGSIRWEKIASIKTLESQHVYDLSIEGTRNFIANDIVAHNTYLATSSGNVGIGNTQPNVTLHVSGRANITDYLEVGKGLNVSNGMNILSGNVGIGTAAPPTKLDVQGKANFTGNFSIGQPSNTFFVDNTSLMVGINQTAPTSMLHVGSSSANVDSLALRVQDSDGNCAFNPESVDTAWTCSSDARAKTNIKDATSVMPYLLGIPIRDYTVIASGDNKTEVIAQELLEKYPELVHEDNDGYYMVDGMNNWKLVKAIQEQQQQIDELRQQIQELKKG